jgi:thiamine-phosphate pyrophosphorylase
VSLVNNSVSRSKLLCYVTDRRSLPGIAPEASLAALEKKIEQVASAGVDWVQIREKDLSARELAALTRQILRIAASSSKSRGVRILVNDRLDVALAEHASGVHLGEESLPVQEAKRLVQSRFPTGSADGDFLLGVSCHSLEAAQAAESSGADYVFFGPVFATPSKAASGAPQGLDRLVQVCRVVAIPVIAIGGITLENAASCLNSGAAGLAAIRLFQDTVEPALTVRRLHKFSMDCPPRPPADQ